jgi:hypothetical protein
VAIAESRASATAISVQVDVPDSLPRVIVDPVYTQEALTALLCDVTSRMGTGGDVRVSAVYEQPYRVTVSISPSVQVGREALDVRLARRLLEREGAVVTDADGKRRVQLPAESV